MTVKSIDRRIQLRLPWGLKNRRYGQEKGATKIQQHLKPVILYMLTVCTKIKYVYSPFLHVIVSISLQFSFLIGKW